MKKTVTIAVCGISTALSVVLMFLGGVAVIFAYIMPMICGMLMIMLKRSFGTFGAVTTFVATSILSFILVTDKECMLMYVCFFGYYPIIRQAISKIKSDAVKWILKFAVFNASMFAVQAILIYIFSIPFLEEGEGKWFIVCFAVLLNILFVIYDKLLDKLVIIYERKIEKKINRFK